MGAASTPLAVVAPTLSTRHPRVGTIAAMATKKEFTKDEAQGIGDVLGIDWRTTDLEQFRMGLAIELEHGTGDPRTNVTGDDPVLTGKIAWAHLNEIPDYYTRFKKMEEDAGS